VERRGQDGIIKFIYMTKQIIRKASANVFLIFWINQLGEMLPDSLITLDFNPVIKEAKLIKDFAICHYQARPKGFRQWGIFFGEEYFSVKSINSKVAYESIWLDEGAIAFPPNAVIVHRNCKVVINDARAEILAIA
jgi:hypothetical protein